MNNISIVLLGSSHSIHIQRWANGLAQRNIQVHLISMSHECEGIDPRVSFYKLPFTGGLGYLTNVIFLKKLLKQIKPGLINVHYATGYGLLGRLTGFHPALLSVWGSDVFDIPDKSPLHRNIVIKNLLFYDDIASTSEVMKQRVHELIDYRKKIYITPFGIDCNKFKPSDRNKKNSNIIIGTVKTLLPRYGIDILLKSVAELKRTINLVNPKVGALIRLKIIGEGEKKKELMNLADTLGIADITEFEGAISHQYIPNRLNEFDIFVALSRSESFGVAILEASACGLPVVVSDVGGLPEVVDNGKTGFIVKNENHIDAAKALKKLVLNNELRDQMGICGRKWVLDKYSWEKSLDIMLSTYQRSI